MSDLSPNAASHRRFESGRGRFNQDTSVQANTRWVDQRVAFDRRYTIDTPGMRAHYNRGSYLVVTSDGFLALDVAAAHDDARRQIIPENTVFDLTLGPAAPRPTPQAGQFGGHDLAGRYRMDGRVYGRVSPVGGAPQNPTFSDATALRVDGRAWLPSGPSSNSPLGARFGEEQVELRWASSPGRLASASDTRSTAESAGLETPAEHNTDADASAAGPSPTADAPKAPNAAQDAPAE
ncbi:MAG: hypothetical protein AAF288_08035 [Planctomycetota bacterium]